MYPLSHFFGAGQPLNVAPLPFLSLSASALTKPPTTNLHPNATASSASETSASPSPLASSSSLASPPPSSSSAAASSPSSSKNLVKPLSARLLGPTVAAVSEIALFHPIDTIVKRFMSYPNWIILPQATFAQRREHIRKVMFRDAVSLPFLPRMASLYPGLFYAVSFKIGQRVYKFGGQPLVRDLVTGWGLTDRLQPHMDSRSARIAVEALSGAALGVGEVMLIPLDVLKIKSQTNPGALAGRSLWDILAKERLGSLYAGTSWTIARNVPGSALLFGCSALVKDKFFELETNERASFFQIFVSASAGATASIVGSSPLDVIKTRVQNQDFGARVRGSQIVRDIVRTEGLQALWKGITPKLLTVGPKLIFSFSVAQYMTDLFSVRSAAAAALSQDEFK